MWLAHRNKAMSFRSNFRLVLPHVNGVIVVGRLPAPADYDPACSERNFNCSLQLEQGCNFHVFVLVAHVCHMIASFMFLDAGKTKVVAAVYFINKCRFFSFQTNSRWNSRQSFLRSMTFWMEGPSFIHVHRSQNNHG